VEFRASYDMMNLNDDFREVWKELLWLISRYCSRIHLEGLRETMESLI
jgi:hypothetical protein